MTWGAVPAGIRRPRWWPTAGQRLPAYAVAAGPFAVALFLLFLFEQMARFLPANY